MQSRDQEMERRKSVHAESLIRALMTGAVVTGVQFTYDWM